MDPTETVEDYYEALRRGEPLYPYFVERDDVVKFGIGERLEGEGVAEGLREQTRTTDDWEVESRRLQVVARESGEFGKSAESSESGKSGESDESVAWFTDDVRLSWTDDEGTRRSFDTRWSGVLERVSDREQDAEATDDEWRFAQMHVSAPHEL